MPRAVRRRVAVEAAHADFWSKYTGLDGRIVGMRGFGASAPAAALMAHYGFTADNVLAVTTHLTTRDDLAAYNEEYAKYFPTGKPARTTVEVMLNRPELLVEITVTACIPD